MAGSFPKISIVTPSYNQGQYLEDTILSVISQGYPNLEYIIIDGGSTDESVDIIKKYESHLSYWVSEPDAGLYFALQKGFEKSTGEIMAWINSDDMYHKKSLFVVAEVFEKFPHIRWVMGSNTFYDETGHPFVYEEDPGQQQWSKLRMYLNQGKYIQQESVFWKRDLWQDSGAHLNTSYNLAADFELWMRFFRNDQLYTLSYILGGFRLRRENQKSLTQKSGYIQELHAILHKEHQRDRIPLVRYRILLWLSKLIPSKKWKRRITSTLLKLPGKITYDRIQGMAFSKR